VGVLTNGAGTEALAHRAIAFYRQQKPTEADRK
jgi:hypothetical protein